MYLLQKELHWGANNNPTNHSSVKQKKIIEACNLIFEFKH